MLALCSMFLSSYYAQNYAGISGSSLIQTELEILSSTEQPIHKKIMKITFKGKFGKPQNFSPQKILVYMVLLTANLTTMEMVKYTYIHIQCTYMRMYLHSATHVLTSAPCSC